MGFEGNLTINSKVCFSCYKSQLEILMSQLITSLNSQQTTVKCAKDVIDTAMHHTCIFVAEFLLQGESLLLPTAHAFFDQELVGKHNLSNDETKVSVTSRWILSNLTISLGHHLSRACKIRKHGTILYRNNDDILLALSKALQTIALRKILVYQPLLTIYNAATMWSLTRWLNV